MSLALFVCALFAGVAAGAFAAALIPMTSARPVRGMIPPVARWIVPAAGLAWAVTMAFPRLSGRTGAVALVLLLSAASIPAVMSRSRRRERLSRLRRELPTLLDSLVLRTEAGMPLTAALLGSQEVFPPGSPTAHQIALFGRDLDLGRTAVEALGAMRSRMGSTGAEAPLGALIRGLELGTPVRGILAEQSERVRQSLLTEAERFANSLSIRLLVPLLLFIFPASFLVILSPVIVFLLGERPW